MYNILFVLSSDGGPLGFQLLALVNNVAVNMSVQYLFTSLLSVLLSIYPEVELLHHGNSG